MLRRTIGLAAANGRATPMPPSAPHALIVRGMTVSYRDRVAVFSIDADFPRGSMTAVIGPNGAGKSTLIKGILGIVPCLSGTAEIDGLPLAKQRHRTAYVPQRNDVDWDFPATVLDVVLMAAYRRVGLWRRLGRSERAHAMECLDRLGMADFADRQIGRLSGGQQQRVFIARALAQRPDILFLDEPLAGVDAATEQIVIDLLTTLRDEGKIVIAVHHDLTTVGNHFDRALLINVRKMADGPVAEVLDPDLLRETYGGRSVGVARPETLPAATG